MNKYRYLLSTLCVIGLCLFQSCDEKTVYDLPSGDEKLIRIDITNKPDTLFLSQSGSSTTLSLTGTYTQTTVSERNAGLVQVVDVTRIDTVQHSYTLPSVWATTNVSVAAVTNGGVVTPHALGVCNITATAESKVTPPLIVKVR